MKTKKDQDLPLKVSVEGSQLVISIGIGVLAWAAKKRNGGPLTGKFRITDKLQFAKDVARELEREDEIGNSDLAELLDRAMENAANRGSTGLTYPRT